MILLIRFNIFSKEIGNILIGSYFFTISFPAMNNSTHRHPYSTVVERVFFRLKTRKYDINKISDWGLVNLNVDPNKTLAIKYGFSTIGRHPDDDYKSTSKQSSRHHVGIKMYNDTVFISEISWNGSYVYSRRTIDPLYHNDREVRDGDIIIIGTDKFKLVKLKSIILDD